MGFVVLIIAMIIAPSAASAAPITALFLSLGAGAALASVLTNLTISIGLNVLASLTARPRASQAPTIADARVSVRLDVGPRWQMGGTVPVGGNLGVFTEYDASGNFWYIVAHGDAELTGAASYYLDDIPVTRSTGFDGFTLGDVLTDDFCLVASTGAQYEGVGTRLPVFRLYTVTPSVGNAYGALPAAFTAAFPTLPADFRLAGVCYTIVRCASVKTAWRRNMMKWRGALGLGEPNVVVLANFNRMYDPRNGAHIITDSTTWTAGNGNAAIVAAWFRTAAYGQNRPMAEVAWDQIILQANICDTTVLNRAGAPTPLYRAGVAFPDSKDRGSCMADIMQSANAIHCYDDQGLWYLKVGYYAAPTLTFSAARDILSAQTEITDDGELAVDGVVVYYLEPSLNYTRQPCAPWQNPDWFSASAIPNYQTEEILACQDHNQAVRLAKAIGTTMAAKRRATLATTITGILATRERGITLDYDTQFQGAYEVVTGIEKDPSGTSCSFAVVPMPVDKWYLQAGEEGALPAATPALGLTDVLAVPTGVVLTTDGAQIKATFTAPSRLDRAFRFRYRIASSADGYQYFTVNMDDLVAYSAVVTNGATYEVSYQTRNGALRESVWSGVTNVLIQSNPTAPAALTSSSATGGVGAATVSFTTANDINQFSVAIYRGATNVFGSASLTHTVYAGANVSSFDTETGLAVGTWYFWAVPQNNSAIAGAASGPYSAVVT